MSRQHFMNKLFCKWLVNVLICIKTIVVKEQQPAITSAFSFDEFNKLPSRESYDHNHKECFVLHFLSKLKYVKAQLCSRVCIKLFIVWYCMYVFLATAEYPFIYPLQRSKDCSPSSSGTVPCSRGGLLHASH